LVSTVVASDRPIKERHSLITRLFQLVFGDARKHKQRKSHYRSPLRTEGHNYFRGGALQGCVYQQVLREGAQPLHHRLYEGLPQNGVQLLIEDARN
jgi:hypothetical protein